MARKKKAVKADPPSYPSAWAYGKGMLAKSSEGERRTVEWQPYELSEEDRLLTLRITLRIWGGSTLFMRFWTPEEEQAYLKEDSRRVTWQKAMAVVETLMLTELPRSEFVVLYCPPETFGEPEEVIRIYARSSFKGSGLFPAKCTE